MTTDADHPAPPPCVVCIPARNEAERLPRLLASLAAQNGVSARAPLRVVVLANNCTDGTVQAVRDVEASGILATLTLRLIAVDLVGADAHVGTARRMALDAGADWLEADGEPDGILLTTDADARLPAEWVAANLRALEAADIVGGRLVIDDDGTPDPALADLHARIERYWSGVRRLEDLLDPPPYDPAPRHGDHTGASLAVPAILYRAVGGLPALPCGEDNALVGLLRANGARLRHCPDVQVLVSSRHQGRVSGGMATEMLRRTRVLDGEAYLLPEAAHWQALILRRAALRRAFHLDPRARAAACARLGLDAEDLAAVGACPNDIAFVERADRILESRSPPARECALDLAVADLDALALSLRDAA
ncbi:glycosyltransferase family 2 protein [Methylobacterium radiotolerans]|uniref:glycosyltransferase n=1 Tax=Methylobacterium radiotolerans TaxID=31998 RepID=UPI0006AE18E1|nr:MULTISPECIES: glycosyltransferase [Methylobacterium]MDE3746354.1 glycosyltransferase [Methylobacterium radiotolerans]PVZ03743.1 GT2 family glycosyltransferase [Methylobacterium organophilum]UIY41773.1 glycosyltransferase [Methylobacterium radiotolerans]